MKSRLLKIKGAEVLSRKQLKHIKGGNSPYCMQGGYCVCPIYSVPTGETCTQPNTPCGPSPICLPSR